MLYLLIGFTAIALVLATLLGLGIWMAVDSVNRARQLKERPMLSPNRWSRPDPNDSSD